MKDFTVKEMRLAADLLELAGDQFANHGCNDFLIDKDILPGDERWATEEVIELDRQMHEDNGDPEEHNPKWIGQNKCFADWWLMKFFATKLRYTAEQAEKKLEG